MAKERVKTAPSCTLEDLQKSGPLQVIVKINGEDVVLGTLEPRSFSSGSWGYGLSGKSTVPLKGQTEKFAKLQLSCNLVVIGSKPEKDEEAEAA